MDIMIHGGNFIGRGAEAMMLTVRASLVSQVPLARCCLAVNNDRDFRRALAEGFVPLWPASPSLPIRLWQRGLARIGVHSGVRRMAVDAFVNHRTSNPFRCTQWIVDVSGFASSDQFEASSARQRWVGMARARCSGNRIIYMPQSWGPFKNPQVREYTRRLLGEAELVFAREPESYEHLTALGLPNPGIVHEAPDVAFQFHGCGRDRATEVIDSLALAGSDGPLIGFTPNTRICDRVPGEGLENPYFAALVDLVRFLIDRHEARVVLIPHELSRSRKNDPELCRDLAAATARRKRVAVVSNELSAAEVKGIIGCLEFLVASRYHSLVAALSLRIPVGVIGWAHKYNNLMETAGLSCWVADPVRGDPGDMGEVIRQAWSHRDGIRAAEEAAVPALEQASASALAEMCRFIGAATN